MIHSRTLPAARYRRNVALSGTSWCVRWLSDQPRTEYDSNFCADQVTSGLVMISLPATS
jgi:hypothetical protein